MAVSNIRIAAMSLMWGNPVGNRFEAWLEEVKQAGYEGIAGFDWSWGEYIDNPGSFGRLLQTHGLRLASLDAGIGANFDHYRKVCCFMKEMEAEHLVLLGGFGKKAGDRGALAHLINYIGEIAAEYGIKAVYHNHTNNTGETFADMDKLLSLTDPSKVFAMCDTGHATKDFIELPERERAIRFLEKHASRMSFVELKDWNERTELDTPLGEGYCDFTAVFSWLRDSGYSGWITVEQNGPGKNRTALECAIISREFIRKELGV